MKCCKCPNCGSKNEEEFYNPWRTVDIDVPDDLIDIKHEHIVDAVARND